MLMKLELSEKYILILLMGVRQSQYGSVKMWVLHERPMAK